VSSWRDMCALMLGNDLWSVNPFLRVWQLFVSSFRKKEVILTQYQIYICCVMNWHESKQNYKTMPYVTSIHINIPNLTSSWLSVGRKKKKTLCFHGTIHTY
jgi:hypothetical protein